MKQASTIGLGLITWLAVISTATPARAQLEDGTYLLSNFKQGHRDFNDAWGYRSSDGREVALVGSRTETIFVETTDPRNPVELTAIPHAASLWSDIEVYGSYAYIVNETSGGLQIIDLSDLSNIVEVRKETSFFQTAHNVRVDQDAGLLYAPGSSSGMPVLDLSNPTFPTLTGRYTGSYVHDCFVQDGVAHLAQISAGVYRTVDVTTINSFPTLDTHPTPLTSTHNIWVNDANTLAVATDEAPRGALTIFDVADPTNIQQLGVYAAGPASIIHNAYLQGDRAHLAYYTEGYVCVDLSDPARPVKCGQLDTFFGDDLDLQGIWGAYPFQPSGVIYINDREEGLYCLTLDTEVEHEALADTEDELGPYEVRATLTAPGSSQSGVLAADVFFSTTAGGPYQSVGMTPTGVGDEWVADIPGHPAGSVIHYHIVAQDDLGTAREPRNDWVDFCFSVGTKSGIAFYDFEAADDEGWTHDRIATQDDWQRRRPAGESTDPSYAYSGTNAWGNDLGGDGWNGEYADNVFNWLASPPIDCSLSQGTHLRFRRWLGVRDGDTASVLINGNVVWNNDPGVDFEDEQWVLVDLDISPWADGIADVEVRFLLQTSPFNVSGGWNIDDIELYALSDCPPPQLYGIGTAGTDGFIPQIGTSGGAPALGNADFAVECADVVGGALCGVYIGLAPADVEVNGIHVLVDLTQFTLFKFRRADGTPGVGGDGTMTFPAPLPNDPLLNGLRLYVQAIPLDDGAAQGLSASEGLTFRICDAP